MATYHDSTLQPQLENCALHLLEEQPNQLVDDEFEAISHKLENDKPAAGEIADVAKKAIQGCRTSQFILGEWYQKGQILYQNSNTASKWYEKAALQGHVLAKYTLGLMFQTGDGVPRDYIRAAEWLEEAAEQGYVAAQNSLGSMYRDGLHVAQNLTEAVRWFRKLAQKGYADSQYYIAYAYHHGDGVTQDYGQAFEWYTKAAQQGNVNAQFYLGLMHHIGHGVEIDFMKASEWYSKAVTQGHVVAQNHLEAMNKTKSDVVTDQELTDMISSYYVLYSEEDNTRDLHHFLHDLEIIFGPLPPYPHPFQVDSAKWYKKLTTNLVIGVMKSIEFLKKSLAGLKNLLFGIKSANSENAIELTDAPSN